MSSERTAEPNRIQLPTTAPLPVAAPLRAGPSATAFTLAFATIYLVWGSTYLGIRIAVETMPPFFMAAVRFTLAGVLLLGFLKLRGAAWPTARQWGINAFIGTLLLLGGNGLVVWAEQWVPSGITALLLGGTPLFIVLTEWAWPGGTRPTAFTLGAMLVGLGGVVWLAAPWQASGDHGQLHPAGLVALFSACIFWSIGSIYSRHARHGADSMVAAALQMIGGGLSIAVVALFHGDYAQVDLAAVSWRSWTAFVYLIVFGSLVGFSTFVWLMKHSTPARVATYAYVNPIVAVFLGWLLLDEAFTVRTLIASAIIIGAVAVITTQKARAAARPKPQT